MWIEAARPRGGVHKRVGVGNQDVLHLRYLSAEHVTFWRSWSFIIIYGLFLCLDLTLPSRQVWLVKPASLLRVPALSGLLGVGLIRSKKAASHVTCLSFVVLYLLDLIYHGVRYAAVESKLGTSID